MSMTYTARIISMQDILKTLDTSDSEVVALTVELNKLRKYSDIAHIVAHPKNLDRGLFTDKTPQVERTRFNEFRNDLANAQEKVVACVNNQKGIDIKNSLQAVFDEKMSTNDLSIQITSTPTLTK